MATISIEDDKALERAAAFLNTLPESMFYAIETGMRQAAKHVKSVHVKKLMGEYQIAAANVRNNETVSVQYKPGKGAQVVIHFAGSRIPLYQFSGVSPKQPAYDKSKYYPVNIGTRGAPKWRQVHPGASVLAHVLKRTAPERLQCAFVAAFDTFHVGLFERTGAVTTGDRDQIRELYAPSVPQMLGSQKVSDSLLKDVHEHTDEWLERAVSRFLNGG